MPAQHIIFYFIFLAGVSLFHLVFFKPLIAVLQTQPQCGSLTDCTNTLNSVNAFEPFFLMVAVIVGTLWLIVKGINASERDVTR